jgi:hypothetical protein
LAQRPDISNRLFVTEKTTVRECAPNEAIGVGGMFAKMLLKRFWPDEWVDLQTAAAVAAYVAYHVKESVPDCGKVTEIVVRHGGSRAYVPWNSTCDLESLLLRYGRLEQLPGPCACAPEGDRQVRSMATRGELFKAFREEFTKLMSRGILAGL